MSILRGSKLFLVILVSLVSLSTFSSKGYCDKWVKVGSYENFTQYYNSSTISIDKQDYTITVMVKRVRIDKGKIDILKDIEDIDKDKLKNFDYKIELYLFNYKDRKFYLNRKTYYTNSNNVLYDKVSVTFDWYDIIYDSIDDILLKKILKDYWIQR